MTNLEQSIKNSLPNLMELGVGCQAKFKDTNKLIFTCFSVKDKYYRFIDQNGTSYSWDKNSLKESFEILGKPITLPDVLRWINLISENYFLNSVRRAELLDLWDLTIPNLSDQPQEVKDFLEKLKTDQK